MKPKYAIALACVIVIALFIMIAGYQSILGTDSSGASIVKTNTRVKSFEGTQLNGEKYTFAKSDDVIVYEVFASWCLPCRQTVPDALDFAKRHKDVTVIGVAYRDVIPEIEKFEKKYGAFETTIKSTGKIEDALGLQSVPQTLFVVNGIVVYRLYGSATEHDLSNVLSLVKRELSSSK